MPIKNPPAPLERFPYLCKVLYFPTPDQAQRDPYAPREKSSWFMRCFTLPRTGDVLPHSKYLFEVTAVILDDCHSASDLSTLERQIKKVAEKNQSSQPQAILWVEFWGLRTA
ncbi:MAG: hypothetical protein AAF152_14160 [Cyanobacteria bacterium P01_A01_bin.114]